MTIKPQSESPASVEASSPPSGEVEIVPLSRIQKYAAKVLAHNWATIPHVTHHDEADITALEALRKEMYAQEPQGKRSPLAFLIKATARTLRAHPRFNASVDESGTKLLVKKSVNIGVAIDIPDGLVVGVIRECDRKGVVEIAGELAALSRKARGKGLSLEEMSGGTFTVSSLGGIGGTGFTPIINASEVAILGVAKAQWKPMRAEKNAIDWRLMLPLSLSYDHRAINGAEAARFVRTLSDVLAEPARLLAASKGPSTALA